MSSSGRGAEDLARVEGEGVRRLEVGIRETGTSGEGRRMGVGKEQANEREWRVSKGELRPDRRVYSVGKGKEVTGKGRVGRGARRVGEWVRSVALVRHLVKRRTPTLAELRHECCLNGCRESDLMAACR